MRHWRVWGAGFVVVLAACGGGGNNGTVGTVQGTVSLAFGGTNLFPISSLTNRLKAATAEFVPGEVIVRFKPSVSVQGVSALQAAGVRLGRVGELGLPNTALYRAQAAPVDTLALVGALRARGDVQWAQPNYIMRALATPNDSAYPLQWDFPAMNLPGAWDIENGSSHPVTVAVVDTGILSQHPDLVGKILPGYDFITDPTKSNDGDGRDPDPEDPGDEPGGQSSYHGSHVAGTVAALTNNGKGVAGVSWGAKILPVRVLGVGGGTSADIIDGILWAAGIDVPRAPHNNNPAQVINLSLGGKYSCDQAPAYQDAFNRVAAQGAIVAVAAGNDSADASNFTPASCSGVITVGATETRGFRAYYSNYGPRVDIMAPGGDTSVGTINRACGQNGDQFCPDGILSTIKNDGSGEYILAFYQGTSMATPHIAGLLALMKSKAPALTATQALDILKRTARPLTNTACTGKPSAALDKVNPNFPSLQGGRGGDCGDGLVDAQAALQALGGSSPDFSLSLSPNSLSLNPGGSASIGVGIIRTNFGGAVGLSLSNAPSGFSGSFSPSSTSDNSSALNLTVSGSVAPGSYALTVSGDGGGLTRTASLSVLIQGAGGGPGPRADLSGTLILFCYPVTTNGQVQCDPKKSGFLSIGNVTGKTTTYKAENVPVVQPGYYILGWKDNQVKGQPGYGEVSNGDFIGAYLENNDLALVVPSRSGVSFQLDIVQSTGSALRLPQVMNSLAQLRSSLRQFPGDR